MARRTRAGLMLFGGGLFTNALRGPNGSAAEPTFGFSSEIGIGIYKSATGTIGFAANSTLFMTLNTAGALGLAGQMTVTSGAVATSLPIFSGSQTWIGGVTATASKINITDTSSNAASLFADFQIAGTSQFSIRKDGRLNMKAANWGSTVAINFQGGGSTGISYWLGSEHLLLYSNSVQPASVSGNGLLLASGSSIQWGTTTQPGISFTTGDLTVLRDAANVLALRNGTSAHSLRAYYTYTDASNYQRLALNTTSTSVELAAESAGTGAANIDLALTVKGSGNFVLTDRPIYWGATTASLSRVSGQMMGFGASAVPKAGLDGASGNFTAVSGGMHGWSAQAANLAAGYLQDTGFGRVGAAIIGARGASMATGAALNFLEQTAPAAPAADQVTIYAVDNGAGKTKLMALFASGVAQQIAIEP